MSGDRVTPEQVAEVEQRLNQGEWLQIGDLMLLFAENGKPPSRSSVDRWIRNGAIFGKTRIDIRFKIGPSGERRVNPADITRVLAESRKIRSSSHPDGIPDAE